MMALMAAGNFHCPKAQSKKPLCHWLGRQDSEVDFEPCKLGPVNPNIYIYNSYTVVTREE